MRSPILIACTLLFGPLSLIFAQVPLRTQPMMRLAPAKPVDPAYDAAIKEALAAEVDGFREPYLLAVQLRAEHDGTSEPKAQIAVNRDLAARMDSRGNPSAAAAHLARALAVARGLENSDALMAVHGELAVTLAARGNRAAAIVHSRIAWEMACLLHRPQDQIKYGLQLARLLSLDGRSKDTTPIFNLLAALPDIDQLDLELHRLDWGPTLDAVASKARWMHVIELAQARGDPATEALAWDNLGAEAATRGDPANAVDHFQHADRAAPNRRLDTGFAIRYADALKAIDDEDLALQVITRAVDQRHRDRDDEGVAELEETHAKLSAAAGDFGSAYHALEHARAVRSRPGYTPSIISWAHNTAANTSNDSDQAAALAAVRNSLRESELESTRLRNRQIIGISFTILMVTLSLGVAYHFKRRAAAALATARDAAELRAENAQLLALRYQINPHFLFNALAALSGLIPARIHEGKALERMAETARRS